MLKKTPAVSQITKWVSVMLFAATVAVGLFFFNRKRRQALSERNQQSVFDAQKKLSGLSEAEAAKRLVKVDQAALLEQENKEFFRRAFRQNLFNTFNIDLFIIAIIMLLLDSPWSTIGTLIVLALSIAISLFQEVTTKKILDQHLNNIRPQSTVIRERIIRSINPIEVVQDDLLIVRQGNQILLDGTLVGANEIIVEEQELGETAQRVTKRAGDKLYSGSFCVDGRAVYQVNEAGSEKFVKPPGRELELLYSEKTPLERMMETVLRLLFGLAIIFIPFLLIDAIIADVKIISPQFRNAISLIFGIAPTSLFLILILQYATGARRLSRFGALVYKSTTVEKLSNVSVMCLSKSSLVAGMNVVLETIPPPSDREPLTENFIRQVLGDIAHSLPVSTQSESLIAEKLTGKPRRILEIAPHADDRDWTAVTFDEPDFRGTFFIGNPSALESHSDHAEPEFVQEVKETVTQAQRGLGRWFKRFNLQGDKGNSPDAANTSSNHKPPEFQGQASAERPTLGDKPIPGWVLRVMQSMDKLLTPLEDRGGSEDQSNQKSEQHKVLFAYLPEPVPLRDYLGRAILPKDLIPLANLHISDVIRPEAQETIQKLINVGVKIKIMSTDSPERTLHTARMLGLEGDPAAVISGAELEGMSTDELSESIQTKSVFGDLSPSQQTQIIQRLKNQGEYVAMVGNDPGDVPAMQQADLRVATKGGSQVALLQTDIVLLKDSIEALPKVLTTGQRLVKSVLDTFKLHLGQVLSQILLILIVLIFNRGVFPYTAAQGGIVAVFTITIPNIVIGAWSAAGRLTGPEMRRLLARFIIPVGFTLPILSFGVFVIFSNRTPPPEFVSLATDQFMLEDAGLFYAQLAVTYALLFAGWLRIFFLQPPSKLWVGGAPLRGDRRVIGMVVFTIIVFVVFFSIPIFEFLLEMPWLPYLSDFLMVTLCALVWAITMSIIWRLGLVDPIANYFSHARWFRGKKARHPENYKRPATIQNN